jgi:hypothetical protein
MSNISISDWRREAGLVYIENQDKNLLQDAIKFSAKEVKNVTLEELDELMLVLSNYYIYLYSELGVLIARVQMLDEAFDILVAPAASKFSASHVRERRAIAISKDKVLQDKKIILDRECAKLEMLRPVCDTIKNKIYIMSKIYDRRLRDEYRSTRG